MFKNVLLALALLIVGHNSFGQHKTLRNFIPKDFTILDSASGELLVTNYGSGRIPANIGVLLKR
jgi:hypothetical protein